MTLLAPTQATREAAYGRFAFKSEPKPGNPESVRILGGWDATNLTTIRIPQIAGAPGGRLVCAHHAAVGPLLAVWAAWEKAGMLPLVHVFSGAYVARFKRQNGTEAERLAKCLKLGAGSLSNHCYGTAFDINAPELPLGRPLLTGSPFAKLVPVAEACGWYWGGNFKSRIDCMHFELGQR